MTERSSSRTTALVRSGIVAFHVAVQVAVRMWYRIAAPQRVRTAVRMAVSMRLLVT